MPLLRFPRPMHRGGCTNCANNGDYLIQPGLSRSRGKILSIFLPVPLSKAWQMQSKCKAKPSLERRQRTNGRFVVPTAHVAQACGCSAPTSATQSGTRRGFGFGFGLGPGVVFGAWSLPLPWDPRPAVELLHRPDDVVRDFVDMGDAVAS
nr:uncharacterized protein LOC121503142 [Drosophila kikkawai]